MDPSNQLMTVSSAAISQTHPSVRIRGTENNYHPMQCADPRCPNKTPHMHCPFCQKTEVYQDPVILKAHYRVKHVDKGIDFAGLKILRCCDHCDIVGAIKGEKKFKGAHWHCYKCKNGFNRRDEAIKHYKTHFRNPQTTFQIQITQEVNSPVQYYESQEVMQTVTQDGISTTIHPVLTEAIMSTVGNPANSLNNENDSSLANGRANEPDAIQVSVAANETVGSPPETQAAIMIIHEEHMESGSSGFDMSTACQTILKSELEKSEEGKKIQLEHPLNELQNQYKELEAQYSRREQQLQSEINQLKIQLQLQNQQIASLKKREEDLLQQMNMPIDARLQELLAALQMQHVELLQQQLLQVKRAALTGQIDAANLLNGTLKTALKPLTTPLLQQTSNQTVVALVVDDTTSLVPVSPSSFSQTLSPAVSRTASLATNSDVTDSPRSPTNLQNSSEFNNSKVPTGPLVIVDLTESSETSNKREAEELADSLVQKKKK